MNLNGNSVYLSQFKRIYIVVIWHLHSLEITRFDLKSRYGSVVNRIFFVFLMDCVFLSKEKRMVIVYNGMNEVFYFVIKIRNVDNKICTQANSLLQLVNYNW